MSQADVRVRGAASAEELAALITALHAAQPAPVAELRYRQWRQTRLAALRAEADRHAMRFASARDDRQARF